MNSDSLANLSSVNSVKGRKPIHEMEEISERKKLILPKHHQIVERSNSAPPRSFRAFDHIPSTSTNRLHPINESMQIEDNNGVDDSGSTNEDENGLLSKSNSQLNESDLEMDAASSTGTLVHPHNTRRINSETNLNETQIRMSGFMGNQSKRFCASTGELSFATHLETDKSLFSQKNNQNSLCRQSFNSSLYGSNLSLNSNSSRYLANSPFYHGKTMFGGASAYPRRDLNSHKILRNPVQMRPSSSLSTSSNNSATSDTTPLSNTAKRLLEAMNQCSSPLRDARKMGNNINSILKIPSLVQNRPRFNEDDLKLNRSIALTRPVAPYQRPLSAASKGNASIVKPLQIPSMSQLLQMKRLQNNTETVRKIATKSDSRLNEDQQYKLPASNTESSDQQQSNPKQSFKIKSNITKTLLRNEKPAAGNDLPLNLPDIQLPLMRSVPKIDIQMSVHTTPTPAPIKDKLLPVAPLLKTNNVNAIITSNNISVSTGTIPRVVAPTTSINLYNKRIATTDFSFSAPLKLRIKDNGMGQISAANNYKFSEPQLISDKKASDNASLKIANTASDDLFKSLVAKQTAKWECSACMTRNEDSKLKCMCCESPKPGSESSMPAAKLAPAATFAFGSQLSKAESATDEGFKSLVAKQMSAKWECSDCMTRNDDSKLKCLCCEKAKPGSDSVPATTSKLLATSTNFTFGIPLKANADEGFKKLVAQQTAKWECSSCMTRNDSEKLKCLCCGEAKPGTKVETTNSILNTSTSFSFGVPLVKQTTEPAKFSFGLVPDTGFKKLVETQSEKWECTACMTRNDVKTSKCACCEQSKPGSTPEDAKSFSFGSKSGVNLSTSASFTFGVAPKAVDQVDQAKPSFTFGSVNNVNTADNSTKLPTLGTNIEKPPTPSIIPIPTSITSTIPSIPSFNFKAPSTVSSATATASFTFKPTTSIVSKTEDKLSEAKVDDVAKITPPTTNFGSGLASFAFKPTTVVETISDTNKAPGSLKFGDVLPTITNEVKKTNDFSFGGSSITKPVAGGFSFGGFSAKKPDVTPPKDVFGVETPLPSKTIPTVATTPSSTPSFGGSITPATPAAPANTFVFGASNDNKDEVKSFGSFTNSDKSAFNNPARFSSTLTNNNTFGSNTFGANSTNLGAPKLDTKVFGFGAINAPAPSTEPKTQGALLFGSPQTTPSATPVFGASNTTFGNTTFNNNNNESGFGNKMPTFGSAFGASSPAPSSFGSGSASTTASSAGFSFGANTNDEPLTKKLTPSFEFGSQQTNNATPFNFGGAPTNNNVESKPAFSFSATPNLNFSGGMSNMQQQDNSASTTNLFQFGATDKLLNAPADMFAFGAVATNPQASATGTFQFGAAPAQPNQLGINPFAAQSTGSTAGAQRRKIKATRRLQPR